MAKHNAGPMTQQYRHSGKTAALPGDYGGQPSNPNLSDAAHGTRHANQLIATLDNQKHGTMNAYNTGCKCDECKAFVSAYNREHKKRKRAEAKAAKLAVDLTSVTESPIL